MEGPTRASVKPLKIVVAGNHQTGKTMFLRRWKDPDTIMEPKTTIGTDLICDSYVSSSGARYTIQAWDTAGQEAYHSITAPYFRNAHGVILFFDLSNQASFQALSYWIQLVREHAQQDPVILIIGNKCDLPREVPDTAIVQWCSDQELQFFLTSALTGENVQEAVSEMIKQIVDRQERGILMFKNSTEASVDISESKPKKQSGCC